MLMKRLAGSDGGARQEAMFVLGRRVFGSGSLGEHEKRQAFLLTEQKLLETCYEEAEDALTFYYRASMLGRVYRFMTEQRLFHGGFPFEEPRPIAFFPGTFDPFTLSHKGIVRAIRDRGFEVLLAIDEFSWSKRTQPYRIRRPHRGHVRGRRVPRSHFPGGLPGEHRQPRESPVPAARPFPGGLCPSWWAATWWPMPPPIKSPWSRTPSTPSTT